MFLFLLTAARAQGPGSTNTTTGSNNSTACDPFYSVCPDFTNGERECDPPGQAGRLLVNSPNNTAFYYIGAPINVSISYTRETNPE
jgi:hypothetical protein